MSNVEKWEKKNRQKINDNKNRTLDKAKGLTLYLMLLHLQKCK